MKWIMTNESNDQTIGNKAKQLFALKKKGFNVPEFIVIHPHFFNASLPDRHAELKEELAHFFGQQTSQNFAVRSSSVEEDSRTHSFAGQFDTYLNVALDDVPRFAEKVYLSRDNERVQSYRTTHNLIEKFEIGVIVQVLVDADISGVAFSRNPLDLKANEKIITAVYGLGEGLVSGDLTGDTYHLKGKRQENTIIQKTHAYRSFEQGVRKVEVSNNLQDLACLSPEQIDHVKSVLNKVEKIYKAPQDIEFAFKDDHFYLLQSRPITRIKEGEREGEYTLWDNSNIVESYPGITSPLTFSFISKMYERVYQQMGQMMGVSRRKLRKHQSVFRSTLGHIRGRVYYNLLSWYKMLAMLPGYAINARYMEKMMGVKERFDVDRSFKMNPIIAFFSILIMLIRMSILQIRLPGSRRRFTKFVNRVFDDFKSRDFSNLDDTAIIQNYQEFESVLLNKWRAPLVNDFFTMIWYGMLEKKTKKLSPEKNNLHNDLLCGSQDIISVEPVHLSFDIAKVIRENEAASDLFNQPATEVWDALNDGQFHQIKTKIVEFLDKFGDRCVGELKLENLSYNQNPIDYIKVLQAYVNGNAKLSTTNIDRELRIEAETVVFESLKGKPIQKWWFNFILKQARAHVSGRENLRYERTKAFGLVRKIMISLGHFWENDGCLDHYRDIFYLELSEILDHEKRKIDYQNIVSKRKHEFKAYEAAPAPSNRFYTYDNDFSDFYIYSTEKLEQVEGDLKGIGCSPGRVKGKVVLVEDPTTIQTIEGDILVATSTDPGWITLFPTSSAILVERGSILSHSAIVSREMGIPCIVGVDHITSTLKTGDWVEMDGSTGIIKRLNEPVV